MLKEAYGAGYDHALEKVSFSRTREEHQEAYDQGDNRSKALAAGVGGVTGLSAGGLALAHLNSSGSPKPWMKTKAGLAGLAGTTLGAYLGNAIGESNKEHSGNVLKNYARNREKVAKSMWMEEHDKLKKKGPSSVGSSVAGSAVLGGMAAGVGGTVGNMMETGGKFMSGKRLGKYVAIGAAGVPALHAALGRYSEKSRKNSHKHMLNVYKELHKGG